MPTQRIPRQVGLAPTRAVRYRRLPVPDVSTGGGGPCQPTVTWNDTFALDDSLTVIYRVPLVDSFGLTEDALGVKVGLIESVGLADMLTLLFAPTFTDTSALTDNLSVAVKFFDSLGMDDRLSLVELVTTLAESFGITEDLLATVKPTLVDTIGLDDRLSMVDIAATLADTFALAEDFLGVKTGLVDTIGMDDRLTMVDIAGTSLDTFGHDDSFTKAQIHNWTCGRSATPDTDPCGDGWIDQASAGTNHGNETPLIAKGKSTLANDERRALIEFDFTRYTGMTAFVGGTHQLTLQATNTDLLLSVNLTVRLERFAARPFTESTVNWTNGNALLGTLIKQEAFAIAANSTLTVVFTLTDAELDDLLGDWGFVELVGPGAVAPITINVASRENTTVANRPRWDFDLKR